MNGSNFFVDTNFLIYLLNGNSAITPFLGNNFFISEITEMELLGVKNIDQNTLRTRKALIDNCFLINFNSDIKQTVIKLKQVIQIKLPDAIVAASSIYIDLPLITADKSFSKIPNLNLLLFTP